MSDFLGFALKSVSQVLLPEFTNICATTTNEFESFDDILKLYKGGFKLPDKLDNVTEKIPFELLRQVFPADDEGLFKFPLPQVIEGT